MTQTIDEILAAIGLRTGCLVCLLLTLLAMKVKKDPETFRKTIERFSKILPPAAGERLSKLVLRRK